MYQIRAWDLANHNVSEEGIHLDSPIRVSPHELYSGYVMMDTGFSLFPEVYRSPQLLSTMSWGDINTARTVAYGNRSGIILESKLSMLNAEMIMIIPLILSAGNSISAMSGSARFEKKLRRMIDAGLVDVPNGDIRWLGFGG